MFMYVCVCLCIYIYIYTIDPITNMRGLKRARRGRACRKTHDYYGCDYHY